MALEHRFATPSNRRVLVACIFTILAALVASACGSESGGSSSKTIVVGTYAPQTGPNSAVFPITQATDAYFKSVNDSGGINGYKFKYVILDDQYNPANTISAARKLVTQDKVLAIVGGIGTASTLAVKEYLEAQKVPSVGPSTGATGAAGPYTFMMQPNAVNEGAFQVSIAAKQLANGGKIAVAYQNDDVGQPFLKGVEYEASQLGISVTKVPFQLSTTDFTPVAIRLKSSGASVVIVAGTPQVFAPLVKAASSVGMTPKWFGVSYAASAAILNDLPKEQTSNMYFAMWNTLPSAPEASEMANAMKKYYPNVAVSSLTIQGWIPGTLFGEAFKQMTADGKEPSAAELVKALNTFKNYSNDYIRGITYDPSTGVAQPHLPRPQEGVAQWQPDSSSLRLVVQYQDVPRVSGEPGQ